MAASTTPITGAFMTYDAQANREDLSDIIYNIDPFDTPITTAIGRRNISNVVYDWQTEELPALNVDGDIEGFTLANADGTPTKRVSGVSQIMHRDATVSGTQNAVNPAGKRKEMAHQMALVGKALKRDCERVLFGTIQDEALGDGTSAARATFPLTNWIVTNLSEAGDAVTANPDTKVPRTDGTARDLTEAMLNDVMEACYNSGAEPSLMFVNAGNKRTVSTFTGRANSRHMIAANKVVNSVMVYASDFGDLKILPSRWVRGGVAGDTTSDAFLIDPSYARISYLRSYERSGIGKIGDADTEMITTEFGLQVDNEAAHGAILDLNVAASAPA